MDKHVIGDYRDELALARVQTAHLAEMLRDYRDMRFSEFLTGCMVLNQFLGRINGLSRSYHVLYKNSTPLDQILDELRKIPP